MAKSYPLTITDLRGGRNGADPPILIPDDQCLEAVNVDFWNGTLGNKRGGATAIGMTFSSGGPFGGTIGSLLRHVPAGDETAAELWGFDNTGVVGRLAASTQWVGIAPADTPSSGFDVSGASLGQALHLGFNTTMNRSYIWDPSLNKIRRTGLATPAAPTTAALGAGGLSFTRFYRVRFVDISGSDTRRRSEASPATSAVTIAAKLGVQVTRPSLATEDETHWEVEYADAAAGPWYRAAQVAKATTTYDDTAATISTTNLSAVDGINTPPPSWKYVIADDNRVIGAGCWETSGGYTTANSNRVWFTPVLGSSDVGDFERVPVGNFIGLEETPTGIAGPLGGAIWVFSYRRIWKLVPTGVATAPYQKFTVRKDLGCIRHQSIVMADDENGAPALYFLGAKGPYRIGANGIQYLGLDIEDRWELTNLGAGNGVGHGVYHADKHQVWWWVAGGSADEGNTKVVFDVKSGRTVVGDAVRKGWVRHDGLSAAAFCSVMFSNTVGATMSRDLKPYIVQVAASAIWKCDSTATTDAGTAFQAYIDTKEYGKVGMNHAVREGTLIGNVAGGVTITATVFSDFGLDGTPTGTAVLTAAGSETRVQKRLEGMQTAGVGTFRFRIGDASAVSNGWTLDAFTTTVTEQEARS